MTKIIICWDCKEGLEPYFDGSNVMDILKFGKKHEDCNVKTLDIDGECLYVEEEVKE